jgi:hypothetical protein
MRRLLAPARPDPLALGLLAVAALCVRVAGLQHARLFRRGYGEVAAAPGGEAAGGDHGRGRDRGRGRGGD